MIWLAVLQALALYPVLVAVLPPTDPCHCPRRPGHHHFPEMHGVHGSHEKDRAEKFRGEVGAECGQPHAALFVVGNAIADDLKPDGGIATR